MSAFDFLQAQMHVFKVIDDFTCIKIASPRSSEPGYTTRHYCRCFGWLLAVGKFQDYKNLVFVFARHNCRLIVVLNSTDNPHA